MKLTVFTNMTDGERLSGEDAAPLCPLVSRIDVYVSHVFKWMVWCKLSDRWTVA
jgi:cAMP phosphodiesterase